MRSRRRPTVLALASLGARTRPRTASESPLLKKPGDSARILITRLDATGEVDVVPGTGTHKGFRITPLPDPAPLPAVILGSSPT